MNKKWMLVIVLSLSFLLGACGSKTTDAEKNKEIFSDMMEVMATYKSLYSTIYVDQLMKESDELEEKQIKTKANIHLTKEPFTLHQTIEIDTGKGKSDVAEEEVYITEEGMFVDSGEGWVKLPAELHEILMASGDNVHAEVDLEMFKTVAPKMTLEEKVDEYILSYKTKDKDQDELLMKHTAALSIAGRFQLEEEVAFDHVDVEYLKVEFYIDKETKQLKFYNLDLEMQLTYEDLDLHMVQHTESELTKMNELEPVQVPEEILKNAEEL